MILIESEFTGMKNYVTEELNENTGNMDKKYYISGTFTIAEKFNRNRRFYPFNICENAINRYKKEYIDTKTAYGEIMHPSYLTVDLSKSAIRVLKYDLTENKIYTGKAMVLSTPMGQIIQSLIRDGGSFGVSTRGEGQVESMNEGGHRVLDWEIMAVDVVGTPSVSEAMMNQLYEGKLNEMLTKSQTYDFKNAGDTIVKQTLATKDEKLQKFQALMNEIFGTIKGNLK